MTGIRNWVANVLAGLGMVLGNIADRIYIPIQPEWDKRPALQLVEVPFGDDYNRIYHKGDC